ncbi:MAG: ATP-binding cassette domain-containing protein, partial [Deinococcus sp.]|nr:ATP-binding cassette domain-containing protein [Deinococcus sp.]
TTLLKLILGLLVPTQGEVRLFGKLAHQLNRQERSQIGYVRQRAWDIDPSFPGTVYEAAQTALYAQAGLGRWLDRAQRAQVDQALEQVGLWPLRHALVRELSVGQQQRLYLARALSCQPQLLLLDEPTSAVDIDAQRQFYDLITHLNRQHGVTVILVSHDLDSIAAQAQTLLCLNHDLLYYGPVEAGLSREASELGFRGTQPLLHRHPWSTEHEH